MSRRKVNPKQTAFFDTAPFDMRAQRTSEAASIDVRTLSLGSSCGYRFIVKKCPLCGDSCVMYSPREGVDERPIHDLRVALNHRNDPKIDPRYCIGKAKHHAA